MERSVNMPLCNMQIDKVTIIFNIFGILKNNIIMNNLNNIILSQ